MGTSTIDSMIDACLDVYFASYRRARKAMALGDSYSVRLGEAMGVLSVLMTISIKHPRVVTKARQIREAVDAEFPDVSASVVLPFTTDQHSYEEYVSRQGSDEGVGAE